MGGQKKLKSSLWKTNSWIIALNRIYNNLEKNNVPNNRAHNDVGILRNHKKIKFWVPDDKWTKLKFLSTSHGDLAQLSAEMSNEEVNDLMLQALVYNIYIFEMVWKKYVLKGPSRIHVSLNWLKNGTQLAKVAPLILRTSKTSIKICRFENQKRHFIWLTYLLSLLTYLFA